MNRRQFLRQQVVGLIGYVQTCSADRDDKAQLIRMMRAVLVTNDAQQDHDAVGRAQAYAFAKFYDNALRRSTVDRMTRRGKPYLN